MEVRRASAGAGGRAGRADGLAVGGEVGMEDLRAGGGVAREDMVMAGAVFTRAMQSESLQSVRRLPVPVPVPVCPLTYTPRSSSPRSENTVHAQPRHPPRAHRPQPRSPRSPPCPPSIAAT